MCQHLESLLKKLAANEEFAFELQRALPRLVKKPHTHLRPAVTNCSITSTAMGFRSIEWLLGNLDTLRLGSSSSDHGKRIKLGMKLAVLERVVADTQFASTKTYENEILLGSLKKALHQLGTIRAELIQNLSTSTQPSKYQNVATFDSIKRLIFEVEGKRIDAVRLLMSRLHSDLLVFLRDGDSPSLQRP